MEFRKNTDATKKRDSKNRVPRLKKGVAFKEKVIQKKELPKEETDPWNGFTSSSGEEDDTFWGSASDDKEESKYGQ